MLEAMVVPAQAMKIASSCAATGGEGRAVVEVGEFRRTSASGELAGPIAEADVTVDRRGGGVCVEVPGGWLVGDADVDA